MWQMQVFALALAVFHTSEFLLAAVFMRDQMSARSLLISKPYITAMLTGVLEYLLEATVLPSLKQMHTVSYVGIALLLLGEFVRKIAMVTAGANFTHDIQHSKRAEHVLVTKGVYKFVRHPGYLGWFIWAVATQILLVNPICTVTFAYVSWRFFLGRIRYEDWTLHKFFGNEYVQYAATTHSGLPGIP
eukprot:GHRR01014912.1.p1 GENE.GHRR01014912.1~~GHRR01014912.1.p1  ORF type:complete len:188 (+),score=48.82 GHRR01014912.1:142-705(+)